MKNQGWNVLALSLLALAIAPTVAGGADYRDTFPVDKASLVDSGRSPYFVLEPGYRLRFEHGRAALEITVLDETRVVDGVRTRIVEERESKGGRLVEVSRNYYAIDPATGDVYYFGEAVDLFEDGKAVGHEGAWESGVAGARFGLMVPAKPGVGDRFYQELAPRVAMDRAEVVSVDERTVVPAGTFEHCVRVKETSPLEPGSSRKVYAPGVGLVRDDEMALVSISAPRSTAP